jgi:hypothetical protein
MAAGWPTKVTYANGDVFNASDINDTNGTLNYIDPTAATNNQVLTRDSAAGGKVKWANSPANTLTTTGDLYYASAANTPARLGIGSSGQILSVSGGVPAWASAGGAYTSIASGTLSGASVDLTSIPSSYINLFLVLNDPYLVTASGTFVITVNNLTSANYNYQNVTSSATAFTNTAATTSFQMGGGAAPATSSKWEVNFSIINYASTTSAKEVIWSVYRGTGAAYENARGYNYATGALTSAISSIKLAATSNFSGGTYTLYGVK